MICQFGRAAVCRAFRCGLQARLLYTLHPEQVLTRLQAVNCHPGRSLRVSARGFSSSNQFGSQASQKRSCAARSNTDKGEKGRHEGGSNSSNNGNGSDFDAPPARKPASITGAAADPEAEESEEQQKASAQTYRQIVATWISTREADLRGLAAESSLAIRDFLSDPTLTIFGRYLFASSHRKSQSRSLRLLEDVCFDAVQCAWWRAFF